MKSPAPYPTWKKYASYLTDIVLESGSGEHTDHLQVILRKGRLLLQANGAVYSWEDKYYNFAYAFEQLNWDLLPGKECLLLGLGLGSIPQLIEERNGKLLDYTAVEYDEVIVGLAEEYLLYRLKSSIETIVADAEVFIAVDTNSYDLILVDLFVDDQVPEPFNSGEFLRKLKDRLNPGGLIISNRIAYTGNDRKNAERYYEETFAVAFDEAAYLDVRTNLMLYSDGRYLRDPAIAD